MCESGCRVLSICSLWEVRDGLVGSMKRRNTLMNNINVLVDEKNASFDERNGLTDW
jgi:hypothetical protein